MANEERPMLITADEIAQRLSISKRSVWRLADRGALPPRIKIGALTRWRLADIEDWIAAGCPSQTQTN